MKKPNPGTHTALPPEVVICCTMSIPVVGRSGAGGKRYQLKKGDFFIEPQAIVSYKADEQHPWTYYWIGFKGSLLTEYLMRTAISKDNPVFSIKNGGDLIKEKISEMIEISFISQDNDLLLNARLMEILFYLSQSFPAETSTQSSRRLINTGETSNKLSRRVLGVSGRKKSPTH